MIHFSFSLRNIFSKRGHDTQWRHLKHGTLPFTEHKRWEAEFARTDLLLSVFLTINTRCNHSGATFELSLFSYTVTASIFDRRHWDYEKGCYE